MTRTIKYRPEYGNLTQFASRVETKTGNTYLKIPFWFQQMENGDLILHTNMPDDLSDFICKAGLGGENPKIQRPDNGREV